jgi:hypothetical protein
MAEVKAQTTKVVIGPVRLSYAHIWEPCAIEEGAPKKYSASLIVDKSDKKSLAAIKTAIEVAKEEGKVKLGGKIPANLKTPLRDGDVDRPEDEAYAGKFFINANSSNKPGIVDKNKQDIMDRDEVYSGCFVYASITFYAFNTSGNKGIAAGLNHIMKWKDGEPLGGRSRAEDDFADVVVEEEDDLL